MAENIYAELRERLDQYSVGFPASESGIEFKILKYLFSEDDAALFLALTPRLEAPEAVADRIGRPVDETADRLEDMSRRGLLFRLEKGGRVKYGAIPFVHGLFEFQVADLDRELAGLVEEYFYEAFDLNMQRAAEYFLRTVPVARSVDAVHNVASFDDAAAMLRTKEYIVITDCICRKQKKLVDQGCDRPLEACFMFGSMGKYYVDRGMGRQIDQEEALAILAKCQESGLVTQPATAQNPGRHVQLLRRLLRRAPGPQSASPAGRPGFFQPLRRGRRRRMHRLRNLPGPLPDGSLQPERRRLGRNQPGPLHRLRPCA